MVQRVRLGIQAGGCGLRCRRFRRDGDFFGRPGFFRGRQDFGRGHAQHPAERAERPADRLRGGGEQGGHLGIVEQMFELRPKARRIRHQFQQPRAFCRELARLAGLSDAGRAARAGAARDVFSVAKQGGEMLDAQLDLADAGGDEADHRKRQPAAAAHRGDGQDQVVQDEAESLRGGGGCDRSRRHVSMNDVTWASEKNAGGALAMSFRGVCMGAKPSRPRSGRCDPPHPALSSQRLGGEGEWEERVTVAAASDCHVPETAKTTACCPHARLAFRQKLRHIAAAGRPASRGSGR